MSLSAIDKTAVFRALECCNGGNCGGCPYDVGVITQCTTELTGDILELLKGRPEVVRCADCLYGGAEQEGVIPCGRDIGMFNSITHNPDWFCADGRRKQDD